jgi:hypothetical protein
MRFLAIVGAVAILAGIGAVIYFFGGYYSVAAAEPDLGIIHWALVLLCHNRSGMVRAIL